MTLRKERDALTKITVNIFADDWEWAKSVYDKVGASKALRESFRQFRMETEAKIRAVRSQKVKGDVEL